MNDNFLASQEGVLKLTKDVRTFSEALNALKTVFLQNRVRGETWLVQAHKQLGELLQVLKMVVDKYGELNSGEVLSMATVLIKHVKEFDYEDVHSEVPPEIFRAINNLAMSFSNSVSECLTGDQLQISMIESQDCEDLSNQANDRGAAENSNFQSSSTTNDNPMMVGSYENDVLHQMDDGMEIALERAKVLSKYMQDLLFYVKKKAHLEIAHANSLMKLCSQAKPTLTEQSFLPFQSVYCTAIDNDREFASNSVSLYQERVLLQKFVEPLSAKKVEHDKLRKNIRDTWLKEKRRMEEAIANMKKSKANYVTRMQEYQKAKDAALKAGGTHQQGSHKHTSSGGNAATLAFANVLSSSNTAGKVERKRQKEEESISKATQAEVTYRNFVNEANKRMGDLEKFKIDYLKQLKKMNMSCDATVKSATLSYLQMHQELFHPLPVLYQAMNEDAKEYEPGFQYQDFINLESTKMAGSGSPQQTSKSFFKFESFSQDGVVSDTDSISSHDELSPPVRHSSIDDSISSEDPLDPHKESPANNLAVPSEPVTGFTPDSSPIVPKRTSNTKQAISKMKDMLMNRKTHKPLFFGIPFSQTSNGSSDGIPLLVKRCVACIDNSALSTKGIYRVNGVKHRVEKICNQLDISPDRVDLTVQSPHDISGVLKFFLRQLPEPLMQFNLYSKFLQIGKDYQRLIQDTNAIAEKHRQEGKDIPPPNSESLDAIMREIRKNINVLPTANRNTLQYIIAHLTRVATFSKENKMDESNLAIIFGPTLMRPQTTDGNESLNTLMEMPFQSRIVEALLHHKDYIFGMLSHSAGNIFPYCGFNQEPPSTYPSASQEVKPTPPEGDQIQQPPTTTTTAVAAPSTNTSTSSDIRDSSDVQFTLDGEQQLNDNNDSQVQITQQQQQNNNQQPQQHGAQSRHHSSTPTTDHFTNDERSRKHSATTFFQHSTRLKSNSFSRKSDSEVQRRRKSTSAQILVREISFDGDTATTSGALPVKPPRINARMKLRMSLDNLRNQQQVDLPSPSTSSPTFQPSTFRPPAADVITRHDDVSDDRLRPMSSGGGVVMTTIYDDEAMLMGGGEDGDRSAGNASSC